MRMVAGLLFACHGAQKLFGVLGGQRQLSSPLMVTAGIIEFVGGGLVGLGLRAGDAAFVASGMMAVAYFMAHAPGGFWPIVNKGELAVLDRKSTRLNSSHVRISYAVFCLKKKKQSCAD